MRFSPLRDRLVCIHEPLYDTAARIILPEGPRERSSSVRCRVIAVGPEVREVEADQIVHIANRKFVRIMRTRMYDGQEVYVFHEADIDGVEYDA